MMTAADTCDYAHPRLEALVKQAAFRRGGRMSAYEDVADLIGMSGSWVRKFLGRQPGLKPDGHVLVNIAVAYRELCEAVEARRDTEWTRLGALWGDTDEALAGVRRMDGGVAGEGGVGMGSKADPASPASGER